MPEVAPGAESGIGFAGTHVVRFRSGERRVLVDTGFGTPEEQEQREVAVARSVAQRLP